MTEETDDHAVATADADAATALADLPALPAAQRGETTTVVNAAADGGGGGAFTISVANAGESSGYLCTVRAEAHFPGLHPGALYAIFTHPRNDGIFTGIKRVSERRVLEERPAGKGEGDGAGAEGAIAYRRVEVEQVGELKILMVRREFATRLVVEEDAQKASEKCYQTRFHLLSSDALSRFEGSWTLEPAAAAAAAADGDDDGGKNGDSSSSSPVGCRVRLEQQVLPRGVPAFLQRVPVLGCLLRRVSLAAVERLLRDLQAVVGALKARDPLVAQSASEFAVHAALDAIKRERRLAEQLRARGGGGGVASFAPGAAGGSSDEDEDEDEDEDGDGDGDDGGERRDDD